jgi:cellulose synthase/poly-beta-1,6-N-acetylglucosamine synthase-like glycosyltransferase
MDQSSNQNKNNSSTLDKITIIIPCRNEEKFIRGCLDSVINNDYPKDKLEKALTKPLKL